MKNINPLGLFDDHFLLETLSKLGDPKPFSYKACIIFQMTNWNFRLLTGQVSNDFSD